MQGLSENYTAMVWMMTIPVDEDVERAACEEVPIEEVPLEENQFFEDIIQIYTTDDSKYREVH